MQSYKKAHKISKIRKNTAKNESLKKVKLKNQLNQMLNSYANNDIETTIYLADHEEIDNTFMSTNIPSFSDNDSSSAVSEMAQVGESAANEDFCVLNSEASHDHHSVKHLLDLHDISQESDETLSSEIEFDPNLDLANKIKENLKLKVIKTEGASGSIDCTTESEKTKSDYRIKIGGVSNEDISESSLQSSIENFSQGEEARLHFDIDTTVLRNFDIDNFFKSHSDYIEKLKRKREPSDVSKDSEISVEHCSVVSDRKYDYYFINEAGDQMRDVGDKIENIVNSNLEGEREAEVQLYESNNIVSYEIPDGCVIVLKHPITLYFYGKFQIANLIGHVDLFGYKLDQNYKEAYAPRFDITHKIQTLPIPCNKYGLFGKLTTVGLSVVNTEEIVTSIGEYDAVLHLKRFQTRWLDFVDCNFGKTELFCKSKKGWSRNEILIKDASKLNCSFYIEKPHKYHCIHPLCEIIISSVKGTNGRVLLCGGKDVGKSTLLRYSTNRILSKGPVLVIDLDPGQAEFTPPGNISATVVDQPLLGPNFTHLRNPLKSFHIGMIDIYTDVKRYARAMIELFNYCKNNTEICQLPWIINTMGLCNELGEKLIIQIISEVKPTIVVQIQSNSPKKRFAKNFHLESFNTLLREKYSNLALEHKTDDINYTYFSLEKNVEFDEKRVYVTAKQRRYLTFLAYIGMCMDKYNCGDLLKIVPYKVHLSHLNICLCVSVIEDFIDKLLNGKIVAICHTDKLSGFFKMDHALDYIGYGLIRSMDIKERILYILTPVSGSQLQQVNTICYSDWLPAIDNDEHILKKGTFIPYCSLLTDCQRELAKTPKRRFNPLQLLKMKNNF